MADSICIHCKKPAKGGARMTPHGYVHIGCWDMYFASREDLLGNHSMEAKEVDEGRSAPKIPESKIPELFTSTTDEIDGYKTTINLGVARGSSVRSRHVGSEAVAGLKSIVGGELKGVTKLIADTREQALARLFRDAESRGGNAIIGMRFSTSQVWESAAEVMAYGTAVVVKKIEEGRDEGGD